MTALANRRSVMTLYADAADPLGHSVRLVLTEKDINVEIHYIDEDTKPDDLHDLNPYGGLLTLIDRDLVLYDAQIMLEYLDERYPHPPLMPVDPVARANNRQFRYRIVRDLYSLAAELDGDNEIAAANARKALRDNLLAIAPLFAQYPYFMSEEFSLVDLCMAPLLWRLPRYSVKLGAPAKPLMKYADRLFDRRAFQVSLSPMEQDIR
ncbi:MAG: glutathione S-transferase N-terminal domain-containing protein [Gammaproteobacteria bacterium]